jgi:hypothetical protein
MLETHPKRFGNAAHCCSVDWRTTCATDLPYDLSSTPPMVETGAAKIRLNAGLALQSHVIFSTCGALENLHHSITALETLPVQAIETLRDHVADRYGKREWE